MTWQVWVIGGLAVLVLLLAAYAVTLRRRLGAAQPGTQPVTRADADPAPAAAPGVPEAPVEQEYLITSVGRPPVPEQPARRPAVPDAVVLSATLGEPLVKVVALAHGVRRALSPANRNRIAFEVRQEVRRTRKVRKQEMRVAWREMKARERAQHERDAEGLGETA